MPFARLKKIPEKSVEEIVVFKGKKGTYTSLNELAGADIGYSGAYLPDGPYNGVLPGEGLFSSTCWWKWQLEKHTKSQEEKGENDSVATECWSFLKHSISTIEALAC